ncbi:MAG: preprotein translocase subunit SecG [Bacteroidales bacterium]|nr:preprotein translocase subunit SecG [Bacteroidales bacterium]
MLYTIIIILIIIASILLGLVVLMQNSKGGGLSSTFSSSNQIMGVRKTTDFMEKATWTLAIFIVVLCFVTSFMVNAKHKRVQEEGSKATQAKSAVTLPAAAPEAPATALPTTAPETEEE